MIEIIDKYFPQLTTGQRAAFEKSEQIYAKWNNMINVISRKDFPNFYTNHLLHSLSIAKVFSFDSGEKIVDVGTGGGFPGVPLAILFPETNFILLDSIAKKIKVAEEVKTELRLNNVTTVNSRAEEYNETCNMIVTRAVAPLKDIMKWSGKNIRPGNGKKGIIALKGGNIENEIAGLKNKITIWNISDFFDEPFFETKKILFLQA